jgi:prepilin-type N-terminal cleavage/methylation domain-containing protein
MATNPAKINSQAGFTLVEIVVAVSLFALVGVLIVTLMSNILTGSNKQGILLADTDQARKVSYGFTSEVRDAQTSNTGGYPLEKATATEVIFYSNIDKDASVERVRYYLLNGNLYKGLVEPTGSPLAYVIANEAVSLVQRNVVNTTAPVFTFYNGNYNGSGTALTAPVNVTLVKYMQINLQIANKSGLSTTNFYTVSAGGSIRNLKTNLGN